jgi:hypothetical protein
MGSKRIKRPAAMAIAVGAITMATAGSASAQSTSDFANVWAFNGGQVGVIKNADKSFTGIVVRATKSGSCVHPVGEKIWTNVRLGTNLSWSGQHVWFLTGPCRLAPATGNTTWKIFKNTQGKTLLRGCYANWARPDIQPQFIAGITECTPAFANVNEGATIDSDFVPSRKGTFKSIARFPKSKCIGKTLKFKFAEPPTDALATVTVTSGKFTKTLTRPNLSLSLKVAPGSGKVTVKVRAKTLLRHTIKGAKTYKTCS